ncbi:MAG TPA: integrase [Sulfitobacter sp.]|nr:integrase [Sulfitobacter sp.]
MLKITKRKGGKSYYVRGTIAGRRLLESTQCERRSDAEIYRQRREAEILAEHTLGRRASLTFAEAALTYIEAGGEARFLRPILEHFGPDFLLKDIGNAEAQAAAEAIYHDAKPDTKNRQVITPISAVVTMAADEGRTHYRRFKRFKGGGARRTRWLTPEEAEGLLRGAEPRLRPILGVLLGGGARTGEALQIGAEFFYPATGEIYLAHTKNGDPRMIRLPGRAVDMLVGADLAEDGALFRTPKGAPYAIRENGGGQIKGAFDRARDAAGLGPDVTPHVLRHTWATWYYAATRDFGGLVDLGGWKRADVANIYRKLAPGDLADRLLAHGWDFRDLGRVRSSEARQAREAAARAEGAEALAACEKDETQRAALRLVKG